MVAAYTFYLVRMDKTFQSPSATWPKRVSTIQGLKRCAWGRLYRGTKEITLVVKLQNDTGRGKTGPHSHVIRPLSHLASLFAVEDAGLPGLGFIRTTIQPLGAEETMDTISKRFVDSTLLHTFSDEKESSDSSEATLSDGDDGDDAPDTPDAPVRPADARVVKRLIDSDDERAPPVKRPRLVTKEDIPVTRQADAKKIVEIARKHSVKYAVACAMLEFDVDAKLAEEIVNEM
eukprot:TRINITY_DN22958_c0_g1_i1.p1 TRINITY_DN22958_c0_g1~~TRINITY_DN22958_c0_g1_i1.p1  ORF type:complete len:255 (+),score=62.66 TRINITY_DN22958_c0_g1_i1:71-766(+)